MPLYRADATTKPNMLNSLMMVFDSRQAYDLPRVVFAAKDDADALVELEKIRGSYPTHNLGTPYLIPEGHAFIR